MRRANVL